MNKKHISLGLICFIIIIGIGIFFLKHTASQTNQQYQSTLSINNKTYILELATTTAEQTEGLSYRDSLPSDHAMLFVFDHADNWGIWMKDMKFNLDILWLDQNQNVITLQENVSPDTYPNVFYPNGVASYVIEANAGFVQENKIKIGTHLSIHE